MHANSEHETTQDTHMHKEQRGTKLKAKISQVKGEKGNFDLYPNNNRENKFQWRHENKCNWEKWNERRKKDTKLVT